jgi:hypothetical protein
MNSLTRVIPFAGVFLLTGAMVGCGDDDGPSNPPIDGSTPPVVDAGAADACVGGHGEGCIASPFGLAEHGEYRVELFQTGPSGAGDESRLAAQAFFFTGQNPPLRTIGGTPITLRQDLVDQGYVCTDMSANNLFDNGSTAEAQAIVDTRTYIDVGDNATLTNANDATEIITLNKFLASADPAAATDLSANLTHDILYRADPNLEASLNTQYKPAVAGSGSYLALDLGYGEAAFTGELADENGEGEPLVYMPSNFQITTPSEEDFYDEAGVTFTKGQDFEIKYTIDTPEDVAGGHPTIIPFVGFLKNQEVQAYCLKFTPGVIDDGTFIVPFEVYDIIDQDPAANEEGSYFEFGRFTHAAWEALNLADPARIDLMGINCALSPDWVVEDAAP